LPRHDAGALEQSIAYAQAARDHSAKPMIKHQVIRQQDRRHVGARRPARRLAEPDLLGSRSRAKMPSRKICKPVFRYKDLEFLPPAKAMQFPRRRRLLRAIPVERFYREGQGPWRWW